jgi:hypothetical protein
MHLKRTIVALAAVAAVAAVPVAQAAGGGPAHAKFGTPLHIKSGGKKGTLKVTYRCRTGDTLWISAKQTANGARNDALKKEGSSKIAATWLDSHRNPITCDNKKHTSHFTVDRVEKGTKGKLVPGVSWVQFCITKNEKKLILSHSHWVETR